MSLQPQRYATAFDENLAFRMSRLMSDSGQPYGAPNTSIDMKSSSSLRMRKRDDLDAEGPTSASEGKQLQRPAAAFGSLPLSRPTLLAAAARVMEEGKKSKDVSDPIMDRSTMRTKLQSALRHTPQLKALLKGLSHLFVSLNAQSASLAMDVLVDSATVERGGRMRSIALEGWAQVVSHEIETFNGKPFSFHLRDLGESAHDHRSLFDQLIRQGKPLMQANENVAAGSSHEGAAAAAAWLEALVGDDRELVERCTGTMPVLLLFQDGSLCSALHVAAASGSSGAIDVLLSRGAVFGSRDCWNRLPVHTLCIGAAMSEYALRGQQAKMTFVNAFVGLELDGCMSRNDNATRIMVGKESDAANDNCWLRSMRRMLQYSGWRAADVAMCKDDKGLSCAQYAATADALMQLGLLRLLLQSAAEDLGESSLFMLQQHKQQLQLTCSCLRHVAALQFVTDWLGQNSIEEQRDFSLPAAQLQLQHARPMTAKQQIMLRTARALKPLPRSSEQTGLEGAARNEALETENPPPQPSPARAFDPREDMIKFRQKVPSS
jgi:hypothetical protein